tara:strand:+ start:11 stop:265 length:255 start_codon:yes stop_codon:yes gene_type:complete
MILSAGIKQHRDHQKIKEYKHKYILDKMGCCCSTETESWSKPFLNIDDRTGGYETNDIFVEPAVPPNMRSETPYSNHPDDEFVI